MQYQLTLFSGEQTISTEGLNQQLSEILEAQNVHLTHEDGKISATFSSTNPPSVKEIRDALKEQSIHPVGIALQPTNQEVKIAFFDMDSTIIQNECIDEMARMCDLKKGISREDSEKDPKSIFRQVHDYTKNAMEKGAHEAPPFEKALHDRLKIIADAGFRQEWLDEIYDQEIKPTPDAEALLCELKDKEIYTVLVSGGFTFFTQKITDRLGFNEHFSNELQFDETGFLVKEYGKAAIGSQARNGRIIGKEEKRDIVEEIAHSRGVPLSQCLFGGDGGNDALAAALIKLNGGVSVAYHSKNPDLLKATNVHLDAGLLGHIADLGLKPLVSKMPAALAK